MLSRISVSESVLMRTRALPRRPLWMVQRSPTKLMVMASSRSETSMSTALSTRRKSSNLPGARSTFWASRVPIIEARPLAASPSASTTSGMGLRPPHHGDGYCSSGQLTGTRVVHSVISWDALV